MQEVKLNAHKREIIGRKVKNLRSTGLIPANVFGKKTSSIAISLKHDEFAKVFTDAGETSVVKLALEGEKEERPILIQNIQKDPVTGKLLHVDLRQIVLTEKITAQIPVELTGEAPAVAQKLGILIQTANELEVEALPMDLPEHFMVDVSKLEKVGDEVTVASLAYDKAKIKIFSEEDLILAKIDPLAAEEVKPEVPIEAVEGEAVPVESKEPAKEEKKEEKKESGEKKVK